MSRIFACVLTASSCLAAVSALSLSGRIVERGTPHDQQASEPEPEPDHVSLHQVMTCPNNNPAMRTLCMTTQQYDQIVNQIVAILQEIKTSSRCTNNNCKLADFAGCILRASGHDFMDYRNGAGGSDGCLRFDDPDNKGLINCLRNEFSGYSDRDKDRFNKTLHDVYKHFCTVVSLADFLVIAGEAVMGFTEVNELVNLRQDFKDNFRYGRRTSATCEDNVHLPDSHDGCAANEETFLAPNALNMTWRQTAALMGVHTLGKATLENSGYIGWWQDEHHASSFTNNYFISIVNHGWGPRLVTESGKWQWDRIDTMDDDGEKHPEMMLNTDMCLVYKNVKAHSSNCCAWERYGNLLHLNITEKEGNAAFYCGFKDPFEASFQAERHWCCKGQAGDCTPRTAGLEGMKGGNLEPRGPAVDDVHEFAANDELWLNEFKSVWKLATEKGREGLLRTLGTSCSVQTPPPSPPPPTQPQTCQVTLYEHWAEDVDLHTGETLVLDGIGDHSLGNFSRKASSVKVEGVCCKAYGYTNDDCSGNQGTAIEATRQISQDYPPGVIAPATALANMWGCNDCARCVKVTQQCP